MRFVRASNIIWCVLFCALLISFSGYKGCGGHHRPTAQAQNKGKKLYGEIYKGADGKFYTRSHDDDSAFLWWVFVASSSDSTTGARSSGSFLPAGSWIPTTTPPSGPTATREVVLEEESGKPTEEVEEATEVPSDEVITEETTESEVEATESESTTGEGTSSGESGSSSDTGSSDAGGSDGGGDGGSD